MSGPSRPAARAAGRIVRICRALPPAAAQVLAYEGKRRFLRSLANTYWGNYINLSMVFRGELSDWKIRGLALKAVLEYLHNGVYYLVPALWRGFEVHDAQVLECAAGTGRGVLFACQHVGPQRYAFLEVAARGFRVHVAMSRTFVERAARWQAELRRRAASPEDLQVLERVSLLPPVEEPSAALEMVRALRRGEAVMFDVDGNTGLGGEARTMEEGIPLSFLGREIRVRKGIAQLAYRTQAPIIPLLPRWDGSGRAVLSFCEPLLPRSGEGIDGFAERCMKALYGLLEAALLETPEQWEMWSQLTKWQPPSEKLTARADFAAQVRRNVERLRELARRSRHTRLRVLPRRAFVLRVRGQGVLVDAQRFRFFVVSPRGVLVLRELRRGQRLGALLERLGRRFDENHVLDDLARFMAMELLTVAEAGLRGAEGSGPAGRSRSPSLASDGGTQMQAALIRDPAGDTSTLIDVLRARAAEHPDGLAFVFVTDDERELRLSFGQLDRRARAVAAQLSRRARAGERALLVFPPGLDFIVAFFGCLYAGVLAVPCPLPDDARMERLLPRVRTIVDDAGVSAILAMSENLPALERAFTEAGGQLHDAAFMAVDAVGEETAAAWQAPAVGRSDVAFLQYTSGSTASPKGVMVTHGNLMHNVECQRRALRFDATSVQLSWLPQFHDAGLVHGILHPIHAGITCIRMSPLSVAKHPARWLRAVQRYSVTHTGGPNFVYNLCARRIGPESRRTLDLHSWRCAYNAAEPIRASTLAEFVQAFGPSGFRPEAFFMAYGLAEATLLVSAGDAGEGWVSRRVDAAALERSGQALPPGDGARRRECVSSGRPVAGKVLVVDPERRVALPPDRVGEIWIAGPGVARGYWRRPEETEAAFAASLAGSGEGPFLRTGDLGFMGADGQLFVTGRIKDLVITRGRNVHPQDVELSVERSHPALRPNCGVAFAVELDDEEQLVVVHEVGPRRVHEATEVFEAILRALAEEHDLRPAAIVLTAPRSVPKTSSGKVQRQACRQAYLDGRLDVVAAWPPERSGVTVPPAAATPPSGEPAPGARDASASRAASMIEWLRAYAAERVNSRLIDERRCIPPYVVLDLGNQGFMGMLAPERYGGLALATRDVARLLEQMAAIDLTLASFVSGHNILGIRPIARHATDAVRAEHLPKLAAGREIGALAMTEEGAGANVHAIEAVALPDGRGGWSLRGKKIWSGSSSWAGLINVFVRLGGGNGSAQGFAGFVVPQGARGLSFGPEDATMGLRGMVQNSIVLDHVAVGPDRLLGAPGHGMDVAQDAFAFGRFGVAAVSLGIMKRCAQLMHRYASRRSVASGRLLDNPVVLARLSELTAAIGALEGLVDAVARMMDDGQSLPTDAAVACKIVGAELSWRAADDLVQTLGGRGYVETNAAPQILRDTRLLRIFEGPTEALEAFLGARAVHGSPDLRELIERALGSPAVAQALGEAVERVRARVAGGVGVGDPRVWLNHCLGAIACQAILWAAAADAARRRPELARSADWARMRFAASLETALHAELPHRVALRSQDIEDLVGGYAATIGDVEQRHAGERASLDPLLRVGARTSEATHTPGPQEPEAVAAPPAPPRDRVIQTLPAADSAHADVAQAGPPGPDRIAEFVVRWIAEHNALDARTVDASAPLASLGLDSVTAVLLVDDLEKWLGRPLRADLAWSYPSIDALAQFLSSSPS